MTFQTPVVSGPVLEVLPVTLDADALQPTRDVSHACLQGGISNGRLTPGAIVSENNVTLDNDKDTE